MTVAGDDPAPPWAWDHHPDTVLREQWDLLSGWVQWLQTAYDPWVQLPPCWPAHQGLVAELKAFWYWHGWLWTQPDSTDPAAVLRWHQHLREAAKAWRRVASHDHRHHWGIDTSAHPRPLDGDQQPGTP